MFTLPVAIYPNNSLNKIKVFIKNNIICDIMFFYGYQFGALEHFEELHSCGKECEFVDAKKYVPKTIKVGGNKDARYMV